MSEHPPRTTPAAPAEEPPPASVTAEQLEALRPRLLASAIEYTRNEAAAKDLVQDTFEQALKKQEQFEEGTDLKGWLMTILRSRYLMSLRRNKFWEQGDPEPFLEGAIGSSSQEAELDAKQLEALMGKLSPDHQEILALVGKEGLDYDETAAHLGIAVGTVKSRANRARKAFAKILLEAGYIETEDPIVARFLDREPGA